MASSGRWQRVQLRVPASLRPRVAHCNWLMLSARRAAQIECGMCRGSREREREREKYKREVGVVPVGAGGQGQGPLPQTSLTAFWLIKKMRHVWHVQLVFVLPASFVVVVSVPASFGLTAGTKVKQGCGVSCQRQQRERGRVEKRQERGRKDTEIRCKGDKGKAAKKRQAAWKCQKAAATNSRWHSSNNNKESRNFYNK